MSPKIIFTLALVFTVTMIGTFASSIRPYYHSCNDNCKEDWMMESLESTFQEFQDRASELCDGERIVEALGNMSHRIRSEMITGLVPASNSVAFFPILALINLLIFIVILLINILEGAAAVVANPAGFEPSTLQGWYVDSYSRIQQFYYTSPNEISDCIYDYVQTAKCIFEELYYSIGGEYGF